MKRRIQFECLRTIRLLTKTFVVRSIPAGLLKCGRILNNVFPSAANSLRPNYFVEGIQLQDYVLKDLTYTKRTLNGRLHFKNFASFRFDCFQAAREAFAIEGKCRLWANF
jgi:hypothetical protein